MELFAGLKGSGCEPIDPFGVLHSRSLFSTLQSRERLPKKGLSGHIAPNLRSLSATERDDLGIITTFKLLVGNICRKVS